MPNQNNRGFEEMKACLQVSVLSIKYYFVHVIPNALAACHHGNIKEGTIGPGLSLNHHFNQVEISFPFLLKPFPKTLGETTGEEQVMHSFSSAAVT